jgi:hypothetical protein
MAAGVLLLVAAILSRQLECHGSWSAVSAVLLWQLVCFYSCSDIWYVMTAGGSAMM